MDRITQGGKSRGSGKLDAWFFYKGRLILISMPGEVLKHNIKCQFVNAKLYQGS